MMVDTFGESKVTVKKGELLKAIRDNRTSHEADYKEAEEGYRSKSIAKLKAALRAAEEGEEIRSSTGLTAPTQHLKDYDRVIRMLEMSVAEEITISEQQFQQYVMDEWNWKRDFSASNALYSNKVR